METAYDIEKIKGNFTEKALLKSISGKGANLSRSDAMRLYLQKKPTNKAKVMESVIADKAQPYKLRLMAIDAMGTEVSSEDEAVLLKNLNTKDDRILTRVAKVLGRTGDAKALAKLQKVKVNSSSQAYGSIQFAKELIAYRIRKNEETVKPPSSRLLLKVNPRTGIKLKTQMAYTRRITPIIKQAQQQIPGIKLSPQGVAQVFCRDDEFLMVFNEAFRTKKDFLSLTKSQAIPMVLLKKRECPDEFSLAHYFFTQPSKKKNEMIMTGFRPGGTLTYSGTLQLFADHFHFEFKTAKNMYVAGLQMAGDYNYETQKFTFTEALSATTIDRKENPKKVPKKAAFA